MNASVLAFLGLGGFFLGFRFYSKYIASKLFNLNNSDQTPAHQHRDNVDYIPTSKHILFGHHFTSIAGAAPIVGPAIAVIWGWLPAFLWVVVGTIFMGAVHDFGALALSVKNDGKTIGEISGRVITPKARQIFLWIIFFLCWVVIAVFSYIISLLFTHFPQTVIPINIEIIVAVILGFLIYQKKMKAFFPSVIALVILYVSIYIGILYPIQLPQINGSSVMTWIVFLMIYSYVASILPVWVLLQPRDYINSHQLLVGLLILFMGVFVASPDLVAPAINLKVEGAPYWFPFLFVTIACGAISGFHGLVSSGTTSKQVDQMTDCRVIGYGGMLLEGSLALITIIAATAGFATKELWAEHYISWSHASGLFPKLNAFIQGSTLFLGALKIPESFAKPFIVVLIISFAATSLDTCARIQRYIIGEMGHCYQIKWVKNRYLTTLVAVFTAFILVILKGNGQGGLILWPIFGSTNQLVAGMTLLIITVYLKKNNKNIWPVAIPMVFVVLLTFVSMMINLWGFILAKDYLLIFLSSSIIFLDLALINQARNILLENKNS